MSDRDNSDRDNSESEKKVHVVDRRRFDSSGKERGEESAATSAASEAAPQASTDSPTSGPNTEASERRQSAMHQSRRDFLMESGGEENSISFTSFVMSLATQTMVQMGEMQPPPGMEIPVDLESARQTIDILGMLQQKTMGNLSSEEARFMEEVLHTLRMSYVRRKRS